MTTLPDAFTEGGIRLALLGLGWAALVLFALAAVCVFIAFMWFDADTSLWMVPALVCAIVGGLCAGLWVFALVPFDSRYWHYYTVSGEVTEVSNVLSEANGDLTRQPVVVLDSVDRPLVVDDPRAVQLQGRDVTLRCTVEWHYQAADTYSCRVIDFGTEGATR